MARRLKSKNKKRTGLRITLLLIIAAAVGAAVFWLCTRNSDPAVEYTELPVSNLDYYAYNGSGILYISGDRLCYTDFASSKNDYSLAISAADARLAVSSGLSVLYNAAAVQIIGSQYPIEFPGTLLSVRCGTSYVAGLMKDDDGSVELQVFSATEQVDLISFTDGYLMDYGFADSNGNVLWTLTANTDGSVPVCTLTTYDMDKRAATGVMTTQGHLVEYVRFDESSIFVIGTNNLIRYDSVTNSESYRLLVYGWELHDFSDNGARPMLLFIRRGADDPFSTVRLYNVSSADSADETVVTLRLPPAVHSVFLSNGRLIAATQDTLSIYSAGGKLSSTAPLPAATDELIKLSDGHMLARCGDALYLVTIE